MIYRQKDGTYVASSNSMWIPGVYESGRAAKYAHKFPWEDLQKLQDSKNPGGIITLKDLQTLRKNRGSD